MSQNAKLVPLLKSGWVTPLFALRKTGTMRLASRIFELRKTYEINSKRMKVGDGCWVCAYHIEGAKR